MQTVQQEENVVTRDRIEQQVASVASGMSKLLSSVSAQLKAAEASTAKKEGQWSNNMKLHVAKTVAEVQAAAAASAEVVNSRIERIAGEVQHLSNALRQKKTHDDGQAEAKKIVGAELAQFKQEQKKLTLATAATAANAASKAAVSDAIKVIKRDLEDALLDRVQTGLRPLLEQVKQLQQRVKALEGDWSRERVAVQQNLSSIESKAEDKLQALIAPVEARLFTRVEDLKQTVGEWAL